MKKLLASLTILTILALPLGSAASAEQQTPPIDLSVEEVHGNIPAQADAAQAMYPAVHSLVLAMTENGLEYAPEDSEFLWTSLYYMLSLYGQMDERAELTDDTLILPSEMVQDYAAAPYPQVEQLPGIPAPSPSGSAIRLLTTPTTSPAVTRAWLKVVLQTPITLASGAVVLTGQLNSLEDGSLLRDF